MFGLYFEEFFHRLDKLELPWGFVPGFHDYETNVHVKGMMHAIKKYQMHADIENKF